MATSGVSRSAIESVPDSLRLSGLQEEMWSPGVNPGGSECARRASVRREAVEQAVAAGALEIVLAAAAVRPARGMRRVPGLRLDRVAQAFAVDVAEHGGALGAAGPV